LTTPSRRRDRVVGTQLIGEGLWRWLVGEVDISDGSDDTVCCDPLDRASFSLPRMHRSAAAIVRIAGMEPEWIACTSRAVEAYRYLAHESVLQIVFRQGRRAYDYPCDQTMFDAFLAASSKGRFVERVLKPHARQLGWSRPFWIWHG
jgi:hypothetical protein